VVERCFCAWMAGELKPAMGGRCDASAIPERGSEDGVDNFAVAGSIQSLSGLLSLDLLISGRRGFHFTDVTLSIAFSRRVRTQ
jgi:hypothetical protein